MRIRILIGLAIFLALLAAQGSWTQTGTSAQSAQPTSGIATDVSNSEVQAALQKNPSAATLDQALRVVSINGDYNVGLGIVRRAQTPAPAAGAVIEHGQITEVYHVISGKGTLVTGGTLENAKPIEPENDIVKILVGPSTRGDSSKGGVSRAVGPGDVIIIPPNTPHWFSEISSDGIVYLVVRVDPHKVLPAGYKPK